LAESWQKVGGNLAESWQKVGGNFAEVGVRFCSVSGEHVSSMMAAAERASHYIRTNFELILNFF